MAYRDLREYVATLETTKINIKKIGLFVFGFFAIIAIVVGAVYLFTRFVSR